MALFKSSKTDVDCGSSYSLALEYSAFQPFFLERPSPAPHMPAAMRSFSFETRFIFAGTWRNKDYLHLTGECFA